MRGTRKLENSKTAMGRNYPLFLILTVGVLNECCCDEGRLGFPMKHCTDNKQCSCALLEDGTIKVDCSRLGLENIPKIYGNVSMVDVSFNELTSVGSNGTFPTSVRYLDFSYNLIQFISNSSFINIPNLQVLVLKDNQLKHIDKDVFKNVPKLKMLDVSACDIRYIAKGSFAVLTQLSHLNISHNKRLTFRALKNISHDLQYTDIQVIDISKLHCTYGPGIYVYTDDITYLNRTKLKSLYINSNRISQLQSSFISHLPQTLETLHVRDNVFTFGGYVFDAQNMINLKVLDAEDQYITHYPTSQSNLFYSCHDWQREPCFDNEQKGHKQYLPEFELLGTFEFNLEIKIPKNLQTISIAGGRFRLLLPLLKFPQENSLKRVVLNNNNLYSWVGPIRNLHKLEYFDLSNNYCSNVSQHFLSDTPELKTLDVSYNLLGSVLEKVRPFDYLHRLKILNLSNNRIQKLHPNIFENTTGLSHLNLKANSLQTLSFHIKPMIELQYINLADNEINSIPENIMKEISSLVQIRKGNITINLQNNKFVCNCNKSALSLLNWMRRLQSQYGLFEGYKTYTCSSATGEDIYLFDERKVREIEENCAGYVGLIVGVIVCIVLSISALMCGLVYRYRWRLRYLLFMAKTKYLGHAETRRNLLDDRIFLFDAFVSFAEEDNQFVMGMFPEELENKLGYKLCLHHRDFLAGMSVSDNITNAVRKSRKTVIILSPSYLKSYWCMYEFNMAHIESIYAREEQNIIFIVLYKPVPVKCIPLQILSLMEDKCYIEYPQDQENECVVFWNNIARAISSEA